jgi:hypothetical protein
MHNALMYCLAESFQIKRSLHRFSRVRNIPQVQRHRRLALPTRMYVSRSPHRRGSSTRGAASRARLYGAARSRTACTMAIVPVLGADSRVVTSHACTCLVLSPRALRPDRADPARTYTPMSTPWLWNTSA